MYIQKDMYVKVNGSFIVRAQNGEYPDLHPRAGEQFDAALLLSKRECNGTGESQSE